MIVSLIIKEIMQTGIGYRNGDLYMPVLFFADDGLLTAESVRDIERLIDVLIKVSKGIGMEINKNKSNILVYNLDCMPQEVKGIKVVKEIKYLGVYVSDSNECFKSHKDSKIKESRRMGT